MATFAYRAGLLLLVGVLFVMWWAPATVDKPKPSTPIPTATPVAYETLAFDPPSGATTKADMLATFGVAMADTGLDFYGRPAKVYRYHSPSEAVFYVVESEGLFELTWYFASSKDDEHTRQKSQAYTKKVYHATASFIKGDARKLFVNMLTQQPVTLPTNVVAAACQHHRCRLVLAL